MAGRRSYYRAHLRPLHPIDHRPCHRIDYEQIEIPDGAIHDHALEGCWSSDGKRRLACRKKLWRRWRTGYYDRHDSPEPVHWDNKGNRIRPAESSTRCCARCRDGHACKSMAAWNPHMRKPSKRCRMHGGHSSGPRTEAGKLASLAALAKGRHRKR